MPVRMAAALTVAAICGCTSASRTPIAVAPQNRSSTPQAWRPTVTPPPSQTQDTSRIEFGTAVSDAADGPLTGDLTYRSWLGSAFTSLTPENAMKWRRIHPDRNTYDFSGADAVVAFAQEHGQRVRGHTLLWHNGNPDWLARAGFSCEETRTVLKEHIDTVVRRYRGLMYEWDVANEIFDENGQLRTQENPFLKACGESIIGDAFRWAHEADPQAVLFLNDYDNEAQNPRSNAYYSFARKLLADGVPVGGFGIQGHLRLDKDFPQDLEKNMRRFADLGLRLSVTEADVRMPLGGGAPTTEDNEKQATYYHRLLAACLNTPACRSFSVWGFTDKYSWVTDLDNMGSASPLTSEFKPKQSWTMMIELLRADGHLSLPPTPPA